MDRKILFPLTCMLFLSFILIEVKGHDPAYEVVAVYGSTPTIDGAINLHEWNDATSISFNYTEVLVKQDGVNLYIAFNMSYEPFDLKWDAAYIMIDVEDNGGLELQPDDMALIVYNNGTLGEANATGGVWSYTDVTGWYAETQSGAGLWQVEVNITYSKIDITAGVEKSVGAFFMSTYAATTHYYWPPTITYGNYVVPSYWGAITSTGYNWMQPKDKVLVHPVIWDSVTYNVVTTSNSSVTDFAFDQPSKSLTFWVEGETETKGYANVTVPKSLLNLDPSEPPFEWTVRIGSAPLTIPTPVANATHTFVYFEYPHTKHLITIMGNEVIPEFPSSILLSLFMTATLLIAILLRRRYTM